MGCGASLPNDDIPLERTGKLKEQKTAWKVKPLRKKWVSTKLSRGQERCRIPSAHLRAQLIILEQHRLETLHFDADRWKI